MLRVEHYSSYMTHPSQQTSCPQQRFYMVIPLKEQSFQDHQKTRVRPVLYGPGPQQQSLQKKQSSFEAHMS